MSGLLDGKVVLINGGTQGVGGATARAAVREGAQVVVTGRRLDAGKRFAGELETLGGDARFVQTDMADPEQARWSVTRTVEEFGRIDGLCNAAGITTRGTLLDTTPELDMIERHTAGSIVNIISIAAHGGQGYLAPYVAAKAGLAGLTRNAAYAHRWDRIRINGLNIGWTESEGETQTQRQFHQADDDWATAAAKRLPMGKLGQPDEIAEIVVLLLSPRSGVVTGSVIDWDQIVIGGHD
jgi:NAD(P)-dependent dehydrogenase (short-subunit alcohol dehydrogenase family)